MGQDVWIREDGVEMLGRHSPRRPGAHICTCWFYNCKVDEGEAMCGAKPDPKDVELGTFQVLGLGHLAKPEDCEKCRVIWMKALLEGNIYHHSIHEETKHALAMEDEREERIRMLKEEVRQLENRARFTRVSWQGKY